MPKKRQADSAPSKHNIVSIIAWLTGIIVSLAVGFGLIDGTTLTIPYIPIIITQIAGWIVVIGAIIAIITAIFNK